MSENVEEVCPKCGKKVKRKVKIIFSKEGKKWFEVTTSSHKCQSLKRVEISRPEWGCPDCGKKLKSTTGNIYFLDKKWFKNTIEICKCGYKQIQPREVSRPNWGCPDCGKRLKKSVSKKPVQDKDMIVTTTKLFCECGYVETKSSEKSAFDIGICSKCMGKLSSSENISSEPVSSQGVVHVYERTCTKCGHKVRGEELEYLWS